MSHSAWLRWARGKCCVLCALGSVDREAGGLDRMPMRLSKVSRELMGDMKIRRGHISAD